jgi:Subtilisin inhibitor-like
VRDQRHSPGERQEGVFRAARRSAALAIPVLVLTIGCANQIAETSGPTPGNTILDTSSEQATPAPTDGTDLTIVINNGSSSAVTWRLTCNPPGGTHPDPKAACRALEANGAAALPPVPEDKACTQIYGGPETASITGTWQGQQVMSRFARNDGCQISRWKLMEGLLPPGGT